MAALCVAEVLFRSGLLLLFALPVKPGASRSPPVSASWLLLLLVLLLLLLLQDQSLVGVDPVVWYSFGVT